MIFDVALPNTGLAASLELLIDVAQAADELGFRALWTIDHVLPPPEAVNYHRVLEPFVVLSYLAALTRRVRLGTGVLVLPQRNPFVVAKQVATLDTMSGGRAVLGVGAGYMEAEFRNLHADFPTRGRRLDEALELCRHLWSGSTEPFVGRYYGYEQGVFGPPPPQGADLPLMIGGVSDAALARAARFGAWWQFNQPSSERFRELLTRLRAMPGGDRVQAGARVTYPGDPEEIPGLVHEWERAGAQHLVLRFGPPVDQFEQMRTFAEMANLRPD